MPWRWKAFLNRKSARREFLISFTTINNLSREGRSLADYYLKVLNCCREFSSTDAAFLALVPRKGDRYKVVASEGKLQGPLKKTL